MRPIFESHNKKIDAYNNRPKSLTSKIIDLCPKYILATNSSDAIFNRARDVETRAINYKKSRPEAKLTRRNNAKNNNNSTIIETTAVDGIEFIPIHEHNPADNIHSTPIIETDKFDHIICEIPIHEQNPSDNILSTPIPDQKLPDVCGIPIYVQDPKDLYHEWSMPEGGCSIGGRWYSHHALERMAPNTPEVREILGKRAEKLGKIPGTDDFKKYVDPRGIPPMVVEDIIQNGERYAGSLPDRENFTNGELTVIVAKDSNKVITVKHFSEKDRRTL